MGTPGNDGCIPFLDTKCSSNPDHTLQISVYRKLIHTYHYLDWNSWQPNFIAKSSHPGSNLQKKDVCSTHEILAKDMDYLHRFLLNNNYPDWMIT